ncbi:MAG: protein-S-isoprenylcysteine O-methyltransferase Ste14 [Halieaceae bacterium]|jgi:protein-S-isoprenylcysteine O-methyltransferase Ste14
MQLESTPPPKFWWRIKIVCGVLLIAALFDRFVLNLLLSYGEISVLIGQGIVLVGGSITLYHYSLLRASSSTEPPTGLVVSGGFYSSVRHPMYGAHPAGARRRSISCAMFWRGV